MTESIIIKYRPRLFKEIVGNEDNIANIRKRIKDCNYQSIGLYGDWGTGKTTLVRVIVRALKRQNKEVVYNELAANTEGGISAIREVIANLTTPSLFDRFTVLCIDEAHLLTKEAASALLKICEEPPPYTWIFLCSAFPEKLGGDLRQRLHEVRMDNLPPDLISGKLSTLPEAEGRSEEELLTIGRDARGSMREALNLLEKSMVKSGPVPDTVEALIAIYKTDISGFLNLTTELNYKHGDAFWWQLIEVNDSALRALAKAKPSKTWLYPQEKKYFFAQMKAANAPVTLAIAAKVHMLLTESTNFNNMIARIVHFMASGGMKC